MVTADVSLAELDAYLQRLHLGRQWFRYPAQPAGDSTERQEPRQYHAALPEAVAAELDQAAWAAMFDAALQGSVVTRRLACTDVPGRCVIRMGALTSTGWPVGVVYSGRTS